MDHFTFNNTSEWTALHKCDMALSEEGYSLYKAVYVVVHTYHELMLQQVESQKIAEQKGLFTDCQQIKFLTFHYAYIYQCDLLNGPSETTGHLSKVILSVERGLHCKTL